LTASNTQHEQMYFNFYRATMLC